VSKREKVPGLDKKRTDIILGGLAPLMGLLRNYEGKEIYINGMGFVKDSSLNTIISTPGIRQALWFMMF
jgi:exopolyphosphatase/pppGpp-phosphohydrolase